MQGKLLNNQVTMSSYQKSCNGALEQFFCATGPQSMQYAEIWT